MSTEPAEKTNPVIKDFLKIFLVPVLINKGFMTYFGLMYSNYPGDGYGYGLITTIFVFVFSSLRFVWKYKDVEDP